MTSPKKKRNYLRKCPDCGQRHIGSCKKPEEAAPSTFRPQHG